MKLYLRAPLIACLPFLLTVAACAQQKNIASGKITLANGQPIPVEVDEVVILIHGVSEAGERASYTPAVKKGAYRQKLAAGQFRFDSGSIKIPFNGVLFTLPLEPVGKLWNKNQDSADGIVQDFVWKPTGAANLNGAKPDPGNHTHWYGMTLGMSFQEHRGDLQKPTVKLPAGTKLLFTLTPKSKSIDGRELEPTTIERNWDPKEYYPKHDLYDLPPANYEITGIAKLPDGSTRTILFQGRGDYAKFVTTGQVPLEPEAPQGYWKQAMGWATD